MEKLFQLIWSIYDDNALVWKTIYSTIVFIHISEVLKSYHLVTSLNVWVLRVPWKDCRKWHFIILPHAGLGKAHKDYFEHRWN